MHLQHYSLPFLPVKSCLLTFWAQVCTEIKILWPTPLGFSSFKSFLVSPFFFLLQWLSFYWACLRFKNVWENVIKMGNFYHGAARCSDRKFCCEFFSQLFSIFVHISGSIRPITLIWALLQRSFPLAEVQHRWCQFWSKVMTSEVEVKTEI